MQADLNSPEENGTDNVEHKFKRMQKLYLDQRTNKGNQCYSVNCIVEAELGNHCENSDW